MLLLPLTVLFFVLLLVVAKPVNAADDIASGTYAGVDWRVSSDYELIIGKTGEVQTYTLSDSNRSFPWKGKNFTPKIESVRFEGEVIGTGNMSYMFGVSVAYGTNEMAALSSFNADGFNTSQITNMSYMFANARKLKELNLSGFDVSNVVNMSSIFFNCIGLEYLDVSTWDVSNATNLGYMYPSYGMKKIKIGPNFRFVRNGDLPTTKQQVYREGTKYYYSQLGWIREDGAYGPYTGEQLRNNYTSDMAGTWIIEPYRYVVFDDTDSTLYFVKSYEVISNNTVGTVNSISGGTYSGTIYGVAENLVLNDGNMHNISATDAKWRTWASKVTLTKKVVFVDVFTPSTTYSWFDNCLNCETFDFRNLDTHNVSNVNWMLSSCNNAREFILGENFVFKPRANVRIILPTPSVNNDGIRYTGKWIREDEAEGPYASNEFPNSYEPVMAGTWVWEVDDDSAVITFSATDGYVENPRMFLSKPFESIVLPTAIRPGYVLDNWNTSKDGSGDRYAVGSSYVPEGGHNVTLYAQWAEAGTYIVNYHQQKTSLDGYDQVASETFYVKESKEVSPELREYEGFKTPVQQTVTVNVGDTVEVDYYYDRNRYAIHFDGNGADSGEMPDQQMLGAVTDRLLDNRFKKTNSWFSGWNTAQDGSGTRYGDAQTVKDVAGDGETFTLYAQWTDLSNASVEATEGKYIVQIEAGQTLTIPNLPAGTHYTIREVGNPDGWSQSGEVDVEGTIPANGNAHGVITNVYNTSGSFQLVAYKMMEIGELNEGDFTFELLNNDGEVIQTKANGSIEVQEEVLSENGETTVENPYYGMSKITFDDIQVTEPGDLTYRIREINGGSSDIIYDVHEENVVVHISDNHDGTLTCVPEYDSDGPVFINSKIPVFDTEEFGDLFISKQVSNMDESDAMFDFKVTLMDASGVELTDSYPYDLVKTEGRENYKTGEVVTVSAVSHTENLDNMGEQNGNYGENWSNANIRGTDRESASGEAHVLTIPGAKSLHVSIVYGGEASGSASALQDYVCVWQGAHPTYTASVNASQSLVGKLGGGDHTNTDNIQEFDIQSNSVTFGYRSDGSECGDGYGYYAVVTGEVDQKEYDEEYYISSGSITSGQTVHVGSGQTLVVEHLPEGVQYTVEELSKAGYEQTGKSGDTGVIPANSAAEAAFTNVYSGEGDVQIQMSKQLLGGTLAGGEFIFELRDSAGGVLQTKTNNAEGDIVFDAIHYTQADAGKKFAYSVNEVQGEGSYVYDTHIEDVTVDVADNGDGTLDVQIAYAGDAKFVNYASRPVVISKQDINGNEIAGAQLEITGRADGAAADIEPIIWMSMEGVNKQVELAPGNYVLHEKAVPDSGLYVIASDISFRVETDGTVKVADESVEMVTMVDDYSTHSVVISKTDINGNEIEGAQLSVTGTTVSGEEIEAITWTSVEGQNKEISLQPGTYTLHETAVPDSDVYVLASDITFTVDTEGNVKVDGTDVDKVTMVDDYTPHVVKIKKVNPSSIAVIGANLRITGRETGSDVDIEAITWTTAEGDEEHEVQLKPGDYKLEETLVPSGYIKADDILFKVNADGSVVVNDQTVEDETVIMTDAYDESGSLNITKTVRADNIDTNKSFEFLVTIEDEFADLNTENWKINGSAIGEVKVEEKDNSTMYSFSLVLKHGETVRLQDFM